MPPAPIRDLRDLTRYRKALIHDRTRVANRLHKALEEAGMKLASVASDILGDYLEDAITTLSAEIERVMAPLGRAVAAAGHHSGDQPTDGGRHPGGGGPDMSVFPGARHLASGAALCPGHHESGGKHKSGKTRKDNRWLRTALIEAAAGASRAKHSALQAHFRRVLRQRGPKKAVVAVAHALLRVVYHVLADGTVDRKPVPTTTTVTIASALPGGPSRRLNARGTA